MVSMQENHHCGICFIDANWKEILYSPIMGLVRNYELISATNLNLWRYLNVRT